MKLWVYPFNLKHAKELIKNSNVDYVIVGLKNQLSCRNNCLLELKQIKKINCDKLAICLNNLYVEQQINDLIKTLKYLKKIKVKTICFTDFAVKQICDEINYKPYLIYNSETLMTNYGQLPFFVKNNINEILLPKELFLNEIIMIGKKRKNIKLQIQAEGFCLMMYSKWFLLTNFQKKFNIKQKLKNKPLFLKEEKRDLANIIIEDDVGTHLFSGYNVSILEYLDKLFLSIDSLVISSYLHNKKWIDKNIEMYTQAIKSITTNKFAKYRNIFIKQIKSLNKKSSCGFLNPEKGLLNLKLEKKND